MPEREQNITAVRESFGLYFPHATVEPIDFGELPYNIKRHIQRERDCRLIFRLLHSDDLSRSFVVHDHSNQTILLQDRNKGNRYIGEGYIYINPDDDIPTVGYTFTAERFRRQGIGTRRLLVMNALSQAIFGAPLSSSTHPMPLQRSIWEGLVRKEQAELIQLPSGAKRFQLVR